ncbi:hypothetical protein BWR17_04470 [Phaeobacter inhibens]|uniref:Swt1 family HEPN domain-containing protein n=1 Tax=Phaeobacter inhibens TaxID=221822 RepID=UPI000971BD30|nr:Swt1 family HEPN domain-containing protein [Phaeobacter inhibens]APX15177.1 hypothetical protein BWR17_04470 [Phaeobacter inhibens]
MVKPAEAVKLFGLNNLVIETEIKHIESKYKVDLGHKEQELSPLQPSDYSEFPTSLIEEAASMTRNYEVFYCLENYIRNLVLDRLREDHGDSWWKESVPQIIRENAEKNRNREIGTGVTPRSEELLDYTNFGELGEIIKQNWEIFGDMFTDKSAITRIFFDLNILRGPIAHCKPLASDEVLRLQLALKSFFRQMS